MTKTFTQDDVVRYLYNEIPKNEKARFEDALICDSDLLDLYHELSATKQHLEEIIESPSNRVIENVLDYSKTFDLHSVKK